jgi:hypothetical protein
VASANGVLTAFWEPLPSLLYTLTPCRIVDTRGGAPVGGPALFGGVERVVQIAGHCGVPPTARAVSVNVTVTQPGAAGSLNLAAGVAPALGTVSYSPGRTRSNNAIIALDRAGAVTALAVQRTGTTVHLIIDVNGYFQ